MDWTLANTIISADQNYEIPFSTHVSLSEFPTDNCVTPGVGLAATNIFRLYTPLHGKITKFDTQKVTPEVSNTTVEKNVQIGLGTEEAKEKNNEILLERERKRKLLGDPVFELMSAPKIKTVKLNYMPKTAKTTKSKNDEQKGSGQTLKKAVHKF